MMGSTLDPPPSDTAPMAAPHTRSDVGVAAVSTTPDVQLDTGVHATFPDAFLKNPANLNKHVT